MMIQVIEMIGVFKKGSISMYKYRLVGNRSKINRRDGKGVNMIQVIRLIGKIKTMIATLEAVMVQYSIVVRPKK